MNPTPGPVRINPWPKSRFQESGDNVSKHRDFVDSKEFQRGTDFALLQTIYEISAGIVDGNTAHAAGWMIKGAVDYVSRLRMLSENPPPPKTTPPPNLDHTVR